MTQPQDRTLSALLASRLRPLVRGMRRALWRHVGRFVTVSPSPYGRGRRRSSTPDSPPHRPLRRV